MVLFVLLIINVSFLFSHKTLLTLHKLITSSPTQQLLSVPRECFLFYFFSQFNFLFIFQINIFSHFFVVHSLVIFGTSTYEVMSCMDQQQKISKNLNKEFKQMQVVNTYVVLIMLYIKRTLLLLLASKSLVFIYFFFLSFLQYLFVLSVSSNINNAWLALGLVLL